MNALALSLTLIVAAQGQNQDRALAPAEPNFIDVTPLPQSGATDVPLDTLAWASSFNGTPQLIGPEGELVVEVVRTVDGPFFVQGVRPVDGFDPETRYTLLDPVTDVVISEFTTGTAETTPPPAAPEITSAEQVFGDRSRTLRYGVAAFEDAYIFVNPDNPGDVTFANSVILSGGIFELFAPQEGEVTTTFVAMNAAGVFSDPVTETHEAPTGCNQSSPEPLGLLALLALLTLRRERRGSAG